MHWSSLVSLMRPFLLFGQHDLHLRPKLPLFPILLKTDPYIPEITHFLQLFNNRCSYTTFLRFPQSFCEAWLQWLFSLFGTYNQPWIDATVFFFFQNIMNIFFCICLRHHLQKKMFSLLAHSVEKDDCSLCGLFFALSTVISQSHSVYKITKCLIMCF